MAKYPSEEQDRFIVRLPTGMRDRIKVAAEKNNRSMNAEIVALLEREYPEPSDVMHIHMGNIRRALDLYENEKDPKERMRLQTLVEMMVTSGNDFEMYWDDDEDADNAPEVIKEARRARKAPTKP